ncbi:hypothetical protein DXG01_001753 [Tephrocybe rancida]|nr:hypothetical protein DXG01_001753 [Tephrocybe rancida]
MASDAPTPSSSRVSFRNFKRDSQTAQLDPQQSSAKRTQVLTSSFAHAALERQVASLKADKGELERKLKEKTLEADRLEQDRRWFRDREERELQEKEQESAQWEEEKLQSASQIRSLRATLTALKESQTDLEESHSTLAHSSAQQKSLLASQSRRINFLEAELKAAQALAEERAVEVQEVRAQHLTQAAPSRLGTKENSREDEAVIQAELHRQTTYLRDLERTNTRLTGELTRLRERNVSVAVLQEEKRALEGKLGAMEGLRARVAELELQLQSKSSSTLSKSTSKNDAAAAHALSAMRLTHTQLLSEHGTTLEQLATTKAELSAAEAQLAEAHSAFDALEAEKDDLERQLVGIEGKWQAANSESKFLQELVVGELLYEFSLASYTHSDSSQESYRAESNVPHETPGSTPAPAAPAYLEALLNGYQALKEHEERDRASRDETMQQSQGLQLKETETALEREREKVKESEERVTTLAGEQTAHLAQIDALEQELFELRGEIAGGRHVPPGVRILQLADNPESRWAEMRQAALDRLKSENEALLNRLRELGARAPPTDKGQKPSDGEDGSVGAEGGTADLVPRASFELVNREKVELEEELRQKEKRLLRLKEVYVAKSAEFRDAIASILGVKLSFRPNGEVRATSIYDLGASFAFQPARGTMQLVAQGEGGPQDLPDLMRFWIAGQQCIPGFMASVTLECYENAKKVGEAAV